MCTTTKVIYGCGHRVRRSEECTDRSCTQLDRWRCLKNSDCPDCSADHVELARHRGVRLWCKSTPVRMAREPSLAVRGIPGPWMSSTPQHKEYVSNERRSSTRKRADQAWIIEHESRMRHIHLASEVDRMTSDALPSYHGGNGSGGRGESARQYIRVQPLQLNPFCDTPAVADFSNCSYLESPYTSLPPSPAVSPHSSQVCTHTAPGGYRSTPIDYFAAQYCSSSTHYPVLHCSSAQGMLVY